MADGGPRRGGRGPAHTEITRENRALRDLVAVYRHLSSLAVQNADIATVAQLIAERTHATVALVSPMMDILAAASPEEGPERAAQFVRDFVVHPRLAEVLGASRAARRALRLPGARSPASVIVAPVLVGDDVPAYLMTLDEQGQTSGEDTSLLLTEHAATICGVILGRERVIAAAAASARDDLVAGLLSGRGADDGEIGRWARHLGYDPQRDHHVLAVSVDVPWAGGEVYRPRQDGARPERRDDGPDGIRERAADAAGHFLATRAPDAIISVRDGEVVAVLPEPAAPNGPASAERLGRMCVDRLAELFPEAEVVAGIGGTSRGPGEVARSYQQARRTVETLRRMGRSGQVAAVGDLGIHRLLLQVPDLAELRDFAREVLGELTARDGEHSDAFLETLACYFRENNSPQRASLRLHVHPNTVTYRVRRVEEITGLDLGSYRDRLMAQVALEILDAVGDGQ